MRLVAVGPVSSSNGHRYVSVTQYAALTGMKADTIRWQLERGRLIGRKNRKGTRWRVRVESEG